MLCTSTNVQSAQITHGLTTTFQEGIKNLGQISMAYLCYVCSWKSYIYQGTADSKAV